MKAERNVLAEVHNPYVVQLLYSFQVSRDCTASDTCGQTPSAAGCCMVVSSADSSKPAHLYCRMTTTYTSSWSTCQAATSWCAVLNQQLPAISCVLKSSYELTRWCQHPSLTLLALQSHTLLMRKDTQKCVNIPDSSCWRCTCRRC